MALTRRCDRCDLTVGVDRENSYIHTRRFGNDGVAIELDICDNCHKYYLNCIDQHGAKRVLP